jgi:hypothetical protein
MKFVVIFGSPALDLVSRILKTSKHMLVQTFVPKARIEGLDKRVFVWLSRSDEVVCDSCGLNPGPQGV